MSFNWNYTLPENTILPVSKFESYKSLKLQGLVISQLKKQIQENRNYFSQLIEILLYLSGQGVALEVTLKKKIP